MQVLIPILSKKENEKIFLEKATQNATEVFLMTIIDPNALKQSFGFTATEISQGNLLVQEIKNLLEQKQIKVIDVIEWGETLQKIINYAKLKKIKKISLKNQENQEFKRLAKQLKNNYNNIEII